jgi:MFS family permease
MILDFGLAKDERQTGYYAGILTGAFAMAEFFSGFVYGAISDKISKKKIVLFSMAGCAISIFLFGLSPNFAVALIIRALNGAMSGSVCATKAYISDITDSTNQSRAFSLVTIGWGIGAVGGPAVGGFLSSPVTKYPHIFGKMALFSKFPYLLPCIAATLLMIIGFIFVALFMNNYQKSTRGTCIKNENIDIELKYTDTNDHNNISEDDQTHQSLDIMESNQEEPAKKYLSYKIFIKQKFASIVSLLKVEAQQTVSTICNFEVLVTIVLYFICIAVEIFQDELLPLWSMITTDNGGLGFTTIQIGIVQAIMGFLYLILPVAYESFAKKLGHINSMRIGFAMIVFLTLTPQLTLLSRLSKGFLWTGFVAYCLFRAISGTLTFTASVILLSNAAPIGTSGRVMAYSNSIGCLARFIAPFIAGPCLAISTHLASKFSAPLFLNMPFAVFGALCVVALVLSIPLKKSLNEPKS